MGSFPFQPAYLQQLKIGERKPFGPLFFLSRICDKIHFSYKPGLLKLFLSVEIN
jgi:hypothetical protein